MQSLRFRAMGCEMLAALDTDDPGLGAVLSQVPHWFIDWEHTLSRFRRDSELSRLNGCPGFPVPVSAVLWDVLWLAVDAARGTGGLVTPTLLGELESIGYDRTFEALEACSSTSNPMPERMKLSPRNRMNGSSRLVSEQVVARAQKADRLPRLETIKRNFEPMAAPDPQSIARAFSFGSTSTSEMTSDGWRLHQLVDHNV